MQQGSLRHAVVATLAITANALDKGLLQGMLKRGSLLRERVAEEETASLNQCHALVGAGQRQQRFAIDGCGAVVPFSVRVLETYQCFETINRHLDQAFIGSDLPLTGLHYGQLQQAVHGHFAPYTAFAIVIL
jgi:hypothetical protein